VTGDITDGAPAPRTLLIRGARLLDARQELTGDLVVEDGRIAAFGPDVGASAAAAAVDQVIDGRGRAVFPGFSNTHTHAAMVLFRGYTDDVPLRQWLEEKIWPLERHLTAEHVRAGAALAGLEMLSSGTTAFHDMYFQPQATASAVEQLGMRAVVSQVFFEVFEKRPLAEVGAQLEASIQRLRGFRNVVPSLGPHAPYTVSLEGLALAYRLAERLDVLVHFHIAETAHEVQEFRRQHGQDLVPALDAVGFLGPRLVAAHGIWLTDDDARLLASRGVTISHCPASNMKLGSGWSDGEARALPYRSLRAAGVRVALGTDGAASNNNLDMFETMKLAALLQKHATGDPAALTAHEAFAMATAGGAEALRTDAGLIEVGRRADLVLVDLDRPYLAPGHDLVADLVYAGRPDCVDTVLVEGRVVLRGGRHPEQPQILADARAAVSDLLERARNATAGT
jgi:5-methylthioadenosine/S-adenosylhomocysteine deaminase